MLYSDSFFHAVGVGTTIVMSLAIVAATALYLAIQSERRKRKAEFEADVARVFVLADEDGSGKLSFDELKGLAAGDREGAAGLLAAFDTDKDGEVSFAEWTHLFSTVYAKSPTLGSALLEGTVVMIFEREFVKQVDALFPYFDADQNGKLDLSEVMAMVEDAEEAQHFMDLADANGDKQISLVEWRGLFLCVWRLDPQVGRALAAIMLLRAAEMELSKEADELQAPRAGQPSRPSQISTQLSTGSLGSAGSPSRALGSVAQEAFAAAGSTKTKPGQEQE